MKHICCRPYFLANVECISPNLEFMFLQPSILLPNDESLDLDLDPGLPGLCQHLHRLHLPGQFFCFVIFFLTSVNVNVLICKVDFSFHSR